MRNHYAFWFRRGSRGKNDFDRLRGSDRHAFMSLSRALRNVLAQFLEKHHCSTRDGCRMLARTHHQFRFDICPHAVRKLCCGGVVHGNGNGPAQNASKKSYYPLSAVLAPNQYAVSTRNSTALQFTRKLIDRLGDFPVSPTLRPIAASLHVGALRPMPDKILQVRADRDALHVLQCNASSARPCLSAKIGPTEGRPLSFHSHPCPSGHDWLDG